MAMIMAMLSGPDFLVTPAGIAKLIAIFSLSIIAASK